MIQISNNPMRYLALFIRGVIVACGFLFVVMFVLAANGYGQGVPLPSIQDEFFGATGVANVNGFVCTTTTGTTTPLATYRDLALTTANQNPIRLNAAGRPSFSGSEVSVFLSAATYRFTVYAAGTGNTCNGVTVGAVIRTRDGIPGNLTAASFATKLDDKVCHASQYTGTTPNDEGGKIVACIAVLPATGGTVDVRGLEGVQAWSVCPFTGVTKSVTVIMGVGTVTNSANCTIPNNVTLIFQNGAIVSQATGTTLTYNGMPEAGPYQIFAWAGTGAFMMAPASITRASEGFPVEWWGCKNDSSTDNGACINKAFASVPDSEFPVLFAKGEYCVGTPLVATSIKIQGTGVGSHLITNVGSCANMGANDFLTINAGLRYGFSMRGMQIRGTVTQNSGIVVNDAHEWTISDVHVYGFKRSGNYCIELNGSYSGYIDEATSCSNAARGLGVLRAGAVSDGTGGLTISGFLSGDIDEIGLHVVASVGVGCYNCELNVYGANGDGVVVTGDASSVMEGFTYSGGYIVSARYGFNIGAAATGIVRGVEINGVSIDGCVLDPCVNPAVANSAGVYLYSTKVTGVRIGGTVEGYESGIRTTGAILASDALDVSGLTLGDRGLINTAYFVSENGVQVTDAAGADVAGRNFMSQPCILVGVTGATSTKCGVPAMQLYSNTTAVGNVGGGEDNLMTYTIPAGFMGVVGRTLEIEAQGDTAANANNKTVTCYYGSVTVESNGPTAANAQDWIVKWTLTTGPTTGSFHGSQTTVTWNNALIVPVNVVGVVDMTAAQLFRCTGTSGSSATDDVVQRRLVVKLLQ